MSVFNVFTTVIGVTGVTQYMTWNPESLLVPYSTGVWNFNTVSYVASNLVLNNGTLVVDLCNDFYNVITVKYDALEQALYPERSQKHFISSLISKSKALGLFWGINIVRIVNYGFIALASLFLLYKKYMTGNDLAFPIAMEKKVINWIYKPITGQNYSEIETIFKRIVQNNPNSMLGKQIMSAAQKETYILDQFLSFNLQKVMDSMTEEYFFKDINFFTDNPYDTLTFVKFLCNVLLDSTALNRALQMNQIKNNVFIKLWTNLSLNVSMLFSMGRYFLYRYNLDMYIKNTLREAVNKIYYVPSVEFVSKVQRKIAIRNLLITNKFEAQNLMNSIKIIKKQLKEKGSMESFPSTIILFVGHSGSGKTTAAEVVLNLIEAEMTDYLISPKIASFVGKSPNIKSLEAKDKGTDAVVAAIEFAVKQCSLIYMEDFDQIVSNRMGSISLENYIILNCILRHFNVGSDNSEEQKFHGVAVCTTSHPKKIDPAALRRTGTIIMLNHIKPKDIAQAQQLFIIHCILEAYEDDNLSQILDVKHTKFYLKVLLEKCHGSAPHQTIKIAQNVFTKCLLYGQNLYRAKKQIKAGIRIHPDLNVEQEIMKSSLRLSKEQFEKIAIDTD
jgi:energy-coupling factor transporter ATP-binding protein EcfA2